MSLPIKKSSHKKSTSSHVTETPAATVATVQTTDEVIAPASAPLTGPASGSAPSASISDIASKAIKQLDALEAGLNLNIVVRPNDRNQIRALARVSDSALGLASTIVSESPASFPAFAALPDAAAYVQAMALLASRVQLLATHVQNSVQNQRAPAALQTLALYGVAKNLGRIVENETMRENVTALEAEIAPKRKNPLPKKTKAEKAVTASTRQRNVRITKATTFLAANGLTVTNAPAASVPTAAPTPAPAAVVAPAAHPVTPTPQPATVPAASPAPAVSNGAAAAASPAPAPLTN